MTLRRSTVHLIAVLAALSMSCSAPSPLAENNTTHAIRIDPAVPVFPIEEYMFTADETNYIDKAFASIARRCMERFGIPYRDTGPPVVTLRLGDRRYGVTNSDSVAKHGYHLPPDSPQLVAQAQAAEYHKPKRTADELRVLTGQNADGVISFPGSQPAGSYHGIEIPAGGCLGEGRRALDEDGPGSDFSLVNKLNLESFDQSQATSSVRDAIAGWSNCMAVAGFHYSSPLAVLAAFDLRTAEPSKREVRTAQADVHCKLQTNLVGTWVAAESAIQNNAIYLNHAALTAIRDRMDRELRAAYLINNGQSK